MNCSTTPPYTECPTYPNTRCVIYTGVNLPNINTFTNDRLEGILQKINTAVGGISTILPLRQVLGYGNETLGLDIVLTELDRIAVGANRAGLGKGLFDTSRSGDKGVSLFCAIDLELNWQAGYLRVLSIGGDGTPLSLYSDSEIIYSNLVTTTPSTGTSLVTKDYVDSLIIPGYITSVANTATINLDVTANELTANFAYLDISQFTNDSGYITSAFLLATATGDATGTVLGTDLPLTLATVNSNVGSFGTSTSVPAFTVNAKGLVTAASAIAIPTATNSVTGLLLNTDWILFNAKESALTMSTGLTRITNTVTSNLSTGIAGGQSVIGGTAASENLILSSTSNATKGKIFFNSAQTSAFDEVNQRLGIGSLLTPNTTPTLKLQVEDNVNSSTGIWMRNQSLDNNAFAGVYAASGMVSNSYSTSIRTHSLLHSSWAGVGGLFTDSEAVGGLAIVNGSTAKTAFWNNGSEKMRLNANGNLLLSTTTDGGYKLDVNGTLRTIDGVNLATTSGNVMIGSSSAPTFKLQVEDNTNASSGLFFRNNSTGTSAITQLNASASSGIASLRAYSPLNSGWPGVGGFFTDADLTGGMVLYNTSSANTTFWTNNSRRMDIVGANGNVLIGTSTDAGYKLDVNGTARITSNLTANSFIKNGGTSSQFLKADGSVDGTTYAPTSSLANYLKLDGTNSMIAPISWSGSLRVVKLGHNAGNNNSGENLNALGSEAADYNTGDNVNAFGEFAGINNNYNSVNLFGQYAEATSNDQVVFSRNGGTTMARIGYGGLSESRLYTLPDTSGTFALTSDIPSLSGYVPYTGATTNVDLGYNSLTATGITNSSMTSGSVLFAGASGALTQDNSNFFWDNTNKRLGVGENTPTAKLDVQNQFKVDGGVINWGLSANQGIMTWATGEARIGSMVNQALSISSNSNYGDNSRIFIHINGNIGVNTTIDAGYKFDVNGTCRITGVLTLGTITITTGTGTPEGVVTATVGSQFMRTDGGAGTTLYVKESGTGNTGWVGK